MKLTLGFSPCPNDTFIFDALVNKKIDTDNLDFEVILEDVQTLNKWALEGKLDVTKLSYAVLPLVLNNYLVLDSGSALGRGVGPILIKKEKVKNENIINEIVAIPGENTTAHLLFSLAYPDMKNKVFMRYDNIEDFVLSGKGIGVLIHENRFTYEKKGLKKIIDLGEFWEKETGGPIPLGGIAVKKNTANDVQIKIDSLIKKSIEYAYSKYPELNDYIRNHSQEMSEEVMRKHIDLYVNNYSIDLGVEGRHAVKKLVEVFCRQHNGINLPENIFLETTAL